MYLVREGIVYNKGEYHNAALFVDAKGMVSGNCRSIFTNHFKAEDFAGERIYPVEFRNPKTIEYTATIHLPDGYEVYDLPHKISLQQPKCGASATNLTKAQGKIVQFGVTIKLQQWWQQMCSMFDEMIVLRSKGGKSFTDTEKITA